MCELLCFLLLDWGLINGYVMYVAQLSLTPEKICVGGS